MMLLRLWNWAGGGVPLGPGIALFLAVLWPLVLYLFVRPTGALQGRRPWRWVLVWWMLLAGSHLALRHRMTPAPPDGLLLWPPEAPVAAAGEAVFARAELHLRAARLAGSLRWDGPAPRPLVTLHLLEAGRFQPATTVAADSLMRHLRLAWLLNLVERPNGPVLCLWRRSWEVTTLADVEACPQAGLPDALAAALDRLLARHVQGWQPAGRPWRAEWLPLYQPVQDSTQVLAALPPDPLPPLEDLRRTELLRALGGDPAAVAAGVNRALDLAAKDPGLGAEPWLTAGFHFAGAGQWEQVRQALVNAISREPAHPLIYWQLAHLSSSRLREFGLADAAAARARCLDLQPLFLPALLAQAPDWMDHRHGGRATAAVEAALCAYPGRAELHLLRGNLAYRLLEHEQAVASYLACSRLAPADPRPLLNLGQLWVVLREWDKAVPVLERAVALGAPAHAQYLIGYCHQKAGRPREAAEAYRRRLALPGDAEELAQAQRQLEKALAAPAPGATP